MNIFYVTVTMAEMSAESNQCAAQITIWNYYFGVFFFSSYKNITLWSFTLHFHLNYSSLCFGKESCNAFHSFNTLSVHLENCNFFLSLPLPRVFVRKTLSRNFKFPWKKPDVFATLQCFTFSWNENTFWLWTKRGQKKNKKKNSE